MPTEKVVLYQRDIRNPLPKPHQQEYKFLLTKIETADTFIFPEYFAFHKKLTDEADFFQYSKIAFEWLVQLSLEKEAKDTLIIGGSLLLPINNTFYNSTPIIFNGQKTESYEKQRLFGHEINNISAGNSFKTIQHPKSKSKWGFLICADVLIADVFSNYKECDFIAIPTSSPFLKDDSAQKRQKRDRDIFIRGATLSNATLFKCCSVGQVGKDKPDQLAARLQGRSLIANSNEILASAPDIYWSGILEWQNKNNAILTNELEFSV